MGASESSLSNAGSSDEDLAQNKKADTVTALGAVAGLALAGLALAKLVSSSGSEDDKVKMMKTPGRDGRMPRRDFEDDPAGYFRDLHKNKK